MISTSVKPRAKHSSESRCLLSPESVRNAKRGTLRRLMEWRRENGTSQQKPERSATNGKASSQASLKNFPSHSTTTTSFPSRCGLPDASSCHFSSCLLMQKKRVRNSSLFSINSLSTPLDGTVINYISPYVAHRRHTMTTLFTEDGSPIKFQLNGRSCAAAHYAEYFTAACGY